MDNILPERLYMCNKIKKAFNDYGNINLSINQAYKLWKLHSKGYCAEWETGCEDLDNESLYKILQINWNMSLFNPVLDINDAKSLIFQGF